MKKVENVNLSRSKCNVKTANYSDSEIEKLEQYFNLYESKTEIYDKLKFDKRLKLKSFIKKDSVFSYIYYDISNIDKLLKGNVKVLEKGDLQINFNKILNVVQCIQEYLLVYNNKVFIIKIQQDLKQISLKEIFFSELFDLPIFVSYNASVYLLEDGLESALTYIYIDKDEIGKVYRLDTRLIKQALNNVIVELKQQETFQGDFVSYVDGKLDVVDYNVPLDLKIRNYLLNKVFSGDITEEDLEFDQKIKSIITSEEEEFFVYIKFEINKYVSESYKFFLNTGVKNVTNTLSNNSKVVIKISKEQSSIANKKMTLKKFIYEILTKSKDCTIDFKSHNKASLFDISLLTCKVEDEEKYKFDRIYPEFSNTNNICYPKTKINICKKNYIKEFVDNINQKFLSQKVIFDKDKHEIMLVQYFLVEFTDKKGNNSFIYRLVYNFEKLTFRLGKKEISAIVPVYNKNKLLKMEFLDDKRSKLAQEYFDSKNLFYHIYNISEVEMAQDWYDMYTRCILKLFPKINKQENYELASLDNLFEKGKIVLLKEIEENVIDLKNVNLTCNPFLDNDSLKEILVHYGYDQN